MAYYLSKANKGVVEAIIPILKQDKDITIKTSNSEKLEYIIRGAYSREEYRWIRDKFTISAEDGERLSFKLKSLHVEEEAISFDGLDFFEIVNILTSRKSDALIFNYPKVSDDELDGLINWGEANGFDVVCISVDDPNTAIIKEIKVIKKL